MTTVPMTTVRVLLLPGSRHDGPGPWLDQWAQAHGFVRVAQDDWLWPRRGDWMARLEEALLADDRPALLVAHGLGCHLVAAWAGHSRHTDRVAGALLVAASDLARADLPPQLQGWRRPPGGPLPFATAEVAHDGTPGAWPAGLALLQALARRAGAVLPGLSA